MGKGGWGAELKKIFFERWPCGQPFHDLVGLLIKVGGHNELFVSVTIKAHTACMWKTTELMM